MPLGLFRVILLNITLIKYTYTSGYQTTKKKKINIQLGTIRGPSMCCGGGFPSLCAERIIILPRYVYLIWRHDDSLNSSVTLHALYGSICICFVYPLVFFFHSSVTRLNVRCVHVSGNRISGLISRCKIIHTYSHSLAATCWLALPLTSTTPQQKSAKKITGYPAPTDK